MLEAGLHARIVSDEAFTALCDDRLFPVILPDDTPSPSVCYQVVSTTRKRLLGGDADRTSTRMQFDVWTAKYGAGKQVAAVLLDLLEGFRGLLPNGTQVLSSELASYRDMYENDAKLHRVSFDIRFIY